MITSGNISSLLKAGLDQVGTKPVRIKKPTSTKQTKKKI